jgi:hypothetical protein
MTATKRCPRCGQVKAAKQFYRRGLRLSSYCQPCSRDASREARRRRRQNPTEILAVRAVDRVRQRRRRALGGQDGEGR